MALRSLPIFFPSVVVNGKPTWPAFTFSIPTSLSTFSSPLDTRAIKPIWCASPSFTVSEITDFDTLIDGDSDGNLTLESPWEGAVIYRRDAATRHVELDTTLERLGLGDLSTVLSRSRAAAMGIRLQPRRAAGDDGGGGTPVLVSIDVARRKRRMRLDGILRTVITLGCNRCGEPAAQPVFRNFAILLTEDPVEEPSKIDMGVIYGENRSQLSAKSQCDAEDEVSEEEDEQIDPEDRIYFPAEMKEADISKHVRDLVHLEITITTICDSVCRGLCLRCGTNLNKTTCNCNNSGKNVQVKELGPLRDLKNQMKRR